MSAILWHDRTSFQPPPHFEKRLSNKLFGRVSDAYFFGSYGSADFGPESDVDLILVAETDLPFVERPRLFRDLYDLFPNMDLLVYRREELEELLRETNGFWASVKSTLRKLPLEPPPS